jgi:hypothetical protein
MADALPFRLLATSDEVGWTDGSARRYRDDLATGPVTTAASPHLLVVLVTPATYAIESFTQPAPVRAGYSTKITSGPGSRAVGLAMAFKLIEAAQDRRRMVDSCGTTVPAPSTSSTARPASWAYSATATNDRASASRARTQQQHRQHAVADPARLTRIGNRRQGLDQ